MDGNARILLRTIIDNQFKIDDDGRLISDMLWYNHGIIAVDLDYGKNRTIYEKGLEIRDKLMSEINEVCEELNI